MGSSRAGGDLTALFGMHGRPTVPGIVDLAKGGVRGVPELEAMVRAVPPVRLFEAACSYPGTQGTLEFLDAYALVRKTEGDCHRSARQLVATHGALDGLAHALVAFEADIAVYPLPGFDVGLAARRAGCQTAPVRWQIGSTVDALLDQVDEALSGLVGRRAAVVVNFPSNPGGAFPTQPEWDRLVELTAKAGALLVADDVYRFTSSLANAHSYAGVEPNLVIVDSFSKRFGLPGLRLGVVATSSEILLAGLRESVGRTSVGVSPVLAAVGAELARRYVDSPRIAAATRKVLSHRRSLIVSRMADAGFAPAVDPAGLYLVIGASSASEESDLIRMLRENHGVSLASGSVLGARGSEPRFARLCVGSAVDPDFVGSALAETLREMVHSR